MKNKKKAQLMQIPEPSGNCANCFFKFNVKSSKTGLYCIRMHEEILPDGNC